MFISDETKKRLSQDFDLVVSYSGGKDSTATCLHLFDMGYTKSDFRRVFMDTGWESEQTYQYIKEASSYLGEITTIKKNVDISNFPILAQQMIQDLEDMLGFESPFVRLTFYNHCFPNHFQKWCTKELKMHVFKDFCDDQSNDIINVIGVRRSESQRRSNVSEWEYNDNFDCYTWRPLYLWNEKDVIDIHNRYGIIPNNLYLKGHNRVGCYPCIYFGKKDLKYISSKRVQIIQKFEKYLGEFLHEHTKNEKVLEHLKKTVIDTGFLYRAFFKNRNHAPINEVIEWAKTSRGGKQFELFDLETPTCHKWGLCDV